MSYRIRYASIMLTTLTACGPLMAAATGASAMASAAQTDRWLSASLREFSSIAGESRRIEVDGIPFEVAGEPDVLLSLEKAAWPEWQSDPDGFYEDYDAAEKNRNRDDLPIVQIPRCNYSAAYLLAYAEAPETTTNVVTLRAGRRKGGAGADSQVSMTDFTATVPRAQAGQGASKFFVVRIPLTEAFAQDIEGELIDVELTKEVRLARRSPDPNRYRWRPLGLPSGVRIAALTFEKSPLQLGVGISAAGKLFTHPGAARFTAKLQNISAQDQPYSLSWEAGGIRKEQDGTVPKGAIGEVELLIEGLAPGHYPLSVELRQPSVKDTVSIIQAYHTAFGILRDAPRHHRESSPFGMWSVSRVHFYPEDPDQIGGIFEKLGLRYGMFSFSPEVRARYGVLKGNSFKVDLSTKEPHKAGERFSTELRKNPDYAQEFMLFHEDAISGPHATRLPDIFHDHPPYQLTEKEKERFDAMWKIAIEGARSMRAAHPQLTILLGNGNLPLREEFYRRGYPTELFDAAGNEAGTFGRPPETQPPDVVGNNSSLWMDRQLLDHYGYKEKSLSQCYEIIYPGTNPGNLSYATQADYYVRHILHSLAWGIPIIRPGGIADPGNSYRFSNWGGCGFFTPRPDLAPKPAALAYATLTQVLDGLKYEGFVETGSESTYLLHFGGKERNVYPLWVVRGQRPVKLSVEGASSVRIVSLYGSEEERPLADGVLTLTASATPQWVLLPGSAKVAKIDLGEPNHTAANPGGKVTTVESLTQLDQWKIAAERSALLENYNPLTPRRKGNFTFETAKEGAIKVTPGPIAHGKETMPMYAELVHETGIEIPGQPAEIGLWVNGNSSWGRIIYELTDASGQHWTSIGARAKGNSTWMADWMGKELAENYQPGESADWNTDDGWGVSRVNFDGWRFLAFPLPGQYPGEGYHWPANSQWRSDNDGKVHYPLKLTRIIVELPEKTLYLKRYQPARHPSILMKNVSVVERDQDAFKTAAGEYVEGAQIDVR